MAIQYSIQKMVSDGTLSTIALGIQYLQRNDIYIRIAGEETPQSGAPSGYTWSFLDNTTLKILPVVPNGVEVVVYRRTDVDAMYNIYSQNAQFDEATIDENNQQLLYIAQEYLEQGLPGAGVDTIEFLRDDGTNTYYRIKRTDGSYSDEFAVPSASSSTKVLTREALRRSYAAAGYNLVDGSFEAGGTLVNVNDVLLQESTGKAFSGPAGTVDAGTNPVSPGFFVRSHASIRSQTFQRWSATGVIDVSKAGTIVPEGAFKYDADGAQYVYKADTCYVLEDFGYGPSATPEWNSRVFNALIPKAKGMFIASRTINATVNHDAPVDIINRVTIMLPQSLKIRKTGSTVGSIVRTITPASSPTQSYTFNKDCVFNVIPEDNAINYAIYVNVIGGDLGGDSHSGKGIFDAPMAAYCTLSRIIGSESKFFWAGLDNFQNTFEDIRSRFSEKHFYIPNGTSNNFSRVACDGGKDGTSVGTGFQLACKYTTMTVCAADKLQLSYDIFGNGEVTMVGCGSESFGRLIRTRDNAVAVVKGGKLQYDVVASNLGIAAEPWVSYDNSTLTLEGTTLSAENFSGAADSVAFAPLSRPVAVGTSRFIAKNCKHPSQSSATPVFQGDEIIVQNSAYGEWALGGKRKCFSATSLYIENTTSKQRMQKDIASVPGDGSWVTVGQFDLAAYGSSVMGEVTVTVYSSYASGVGLAGFGKMLFSAVQQSSGGALSVNNSTLQVAHTDFSPAQPSPTIEMQMVASNTTATLQIKLTSGGGTLSPSSVSLNVEYVSRKSGLPGRVDMF